MEIYYGNRKGGGRKAYYIFPYTSRMKEVYEYMREVRKRTRHAIESYYFLPVWVKGSELYLQPVTGGKQKIAIIRKEKADGK